MPLLRFIPETTNVNFVKYRFAAFAVDGLLLTDMTAPQATYDALLAAGSRAVAVPRLLKVTSPEMERA